MKLKLSFVRKMLGLNKSVFASIRDHHMFVRELNNKSIVIDLGANKGDFSTRISDNFGCQCYSIEAAPQIFDTIPDNPLIKKYNYAICRDAAVSQQRGGVRRGPLDGPSRCHGQSGAWGDYDNDGDLDILLTGRHGAPAYVAKVYRNDGGGAFTDIGAGLTGVVLRLGGVGRLRQRRRPRHPAHGQPRRGTSVAKVYRNDGAAPSPTSAPA